MSSSSSSSSSTTTTFPLWIMYGSATGNAENIAKTLAHTGQQQLLLQQQQQQQQSSSSSSQPASSSSSLPWLPFTSVVCCELDQFKRKKCWELWQQDPSSLSSSSSTTTPHPSKHVLLVVTSTTGNGDPPENASRFVRFLKRPENTTTAGAAAGVNTATNTLPALRHVTYAVLGLGDTNYDQFCQAAKTVDARLAACGATRLQRLACADEGTGLEEVVEPWTRSIWSLVAAAAAGTTHTTTTAVVEPGRPLPPPADATLPKKVVDHTAPVQEGSAVAPASPTDLASATPLSSSLPVKGPATSFAREEEGLRASATSLGVTVVQTLWQQAARAQPPLHENVCAWPPPTLDPSTMPGLMTTASTPLHPGPRCKFLPDELLLPPALLEEETGDEVERRPSGWTLDDGGGRHRPRGDSQTTASSAGFHFTHRRPYDATILQARYLTRTDRSAAQQASEWLARRRRHQEESHGNTTRNRLLDPTWEPNVTRIYDEGFPLQAGSAISEETAARNGKRVIEMTLSLPDDYTLEYVPGDSLGLLVENTTESVHFVLDMLQRHQGVRPQQRVSVDSNTPVTVEEVLRQHLDLDSPIKNKRLLWALSEHAADSDEKHALQWLSARNSLSEELFQRYVDQQRLNVVNLLREFPSTQPSLTLSDLIHILPPIPPRYYSVSSSPIEHQRLSLTVAFSVVDYLTPSLCIQGQEVGRRRIRGIATRYLEAICSPLLAGKTTAPPPIPTVPIFPKPSSDFRMPTTLTTPMILIGPGTGVAPFMGFLFHRRALVSSSESTEAASTVVEGTWRGGYDVEENELPVSSHDGSGLKLGVDFRTQLGVGPVDLYFGCRHRDHDWLYRDEMIALEKSGVISQLHLAFSRDDHRNYVQDIMLGEASERLLHLILEREAVVYLCGDGNAMAKDVQAALVDLLSRQLPGGLDEAKQYLEDMKKRHRFLMDIWS